MKVLGVVLIVLGLVGVAYGGFKWTHPETVVDIGPVQVTHDKTERLPIPPIAGAICLIAGTAILVTSGKMRG